ncbi:hypothetical protein B7R22_16310 [Subtercola boreus]|uniref:HTH tetR-type domain-containing protein n=2 Tax=Subtercola boreus TaxID=120213 RepID=A0A3E0VSE6_9MICO|nr:hypothetical protein B7R22_16310 [Subtercola boreus]
MMPKVTAEYREARRDEITAAALRCFQARGLAATSMSDIIAESGLSAGAIYGHFEGKHDIMMAAAREVIGHRIADLRELAGESAPSPAEVVTRMMTGLSGDVAKPSLLLQVWAQAMVEDGVRELLWTVFADIREAFDHYFMRWAVEHESLDEVAAREWTATLMPAAVGLAQGYIVQSAVFPAFDSAAYLASVRSVLQQ